MKKSELRQIIRDELTEVKLTEASEVSFSDMPEETQKILKSLKIDRKVESFWHGIHGNIVHFDSIRIDKKQLAMLLKDPNLRWIDVRAIGV